MELKIKGRTIFLKMLKDTDAISIYDNMDDKEISKYTTLPYPYNIENAYNFIKKTRINIQSNKNYELGIFLNDTEEFVGVVGLMNVKDKKRDVEICYWLGKKFWGKGIMKEAIALILNFGFETLKLSKIHARVMHQNIASYKCLEKSGFRCDGNTGRVLYRKGVWRNDLLYSILDTDFKIFNS